MQLDQLRRYLDSPAEAAGWLRAWGLSDPVHAHASLVSMAAAGLTLDLLGAVCDCLAEQLPQSSDPDMALNNLDRFVAAARSPLALGSLFERDRDALPILLRIFSTSQYFSDLLIRDPGGYDLLRMTEGQPVHRDVLAAELASEIDALADLAAVSAALRRFKRRETLRIAYGDLIRGQSLETVASQISYLAEAIVEAAVRFARRQAEQKRGVPRRPDGQPARFVALALGKLGGAELNYSSDIDLVFLYECEGQTEGRRAASNVELFDRLVRDVVKLLAEPTEHGSAYRVDLRLRPEGGRGPVAHSLEAALSYYDVLGRTWERQAYVKARPVAGDHDLGGEFLRSLQPWIYRRYLSLADITGIKALKRRIERRAISEGDESRNVKTGRGGIRDVEFAIQFLQLLNGGDLPALRTGNTVEAIAQLENVGCLTHQERLLLDENYRFLRKIEHRLQIMFDLQTHLLPNTPGEMRKLAIRMGYRDAAATALAAFEADYHSKTALNRKILDHLLHDAFGDDAQTEPEVDLVLDPSPPPEKIAAVLGRYPFRDVPLAYQNLVSLATEKLRFLLTRRCRHFLASIAPRLLKAVAATPDPDSTLIALEKVSDSLGGKGVLWELFSFSPPSMQLYVELCSSSPYLSNILIGNPGMIDELMDSLVLNKLPARPSLEATLRELSRGAEDLDPILHSFKNTMQLRVGVRDILGKEDVHATTAALSDVAETCVEAIAEAEYEKLAVKWGEPTVAGGPRGGEPSHFAILALGKLGGRELNYHSDLDLVFLYEADGPTFHGPRSRRNATTTTNQHFFSELGQRIAKLCSRMGPYGKLYEVDLRLRPTGKSGALATTFSEFARYFAEGDGQLWERQALTKARAIVVADEVRRELSQLVARAAYDHPWLSSHAAAIRDMRRRMEENAPANNIKRGPGGIVDIEFVVQMLQLKHGRENPAVRTPNTLEALTLLNQHRRLSDADYEYFAASYRFLRTVESRLRLMQAPTRVLPDDPIELAKLAHALGYADGGALQAECHSYLRRNRERFEKLLAAEAAAPAKVAGTLRVP